MIEIEVLKTKFAEMQALPFVALQGPKGPKGDKGDIGPQGETGPQGPKGDNYVLTDADKQDIAGKVDAVKDVQVNGNTIATDRVANINVSDVSFTWYKNEKKLYLKETDKEHIDKRSGNIPINNKTFDYAVKAAMCDGKGAAWSDAEKVASQKRIGVDETNRKLDFLWKLNQGISYQFETDETAAYSKTIPIGAKVAAIHNIGGRSFVWNQMIPETIVDKTFQGVTFATEDGRTFRISGTGTSNNCYALLCRVNLIQNHTYVLGRVGNYTTQNNNDFIAICAQTTKYYWVKSIDGAFGIFTCAESGLYNVFLYFMNGSGLTVDAEITPQLFDVTAMFGAGSEPSTVEEFRAMFPEDYYPYSDNTIIDATSRSIAVGDRTVDSSWLSAKYFPDGMRSAGNVYDELDLENGVAIQRVKEIVLTGSETIYISTPSTYIKEDACNAFFLDNDIYETTSYDGVYCANCNVFLFSKVGIWNKVGYPNKFTLNQNQIHMNISNENLGITDYTSETKETAVEKIKRYVKSKYENGNPITFHIALKTPIVTPITEDLSAFVGISSESGGSVTFVSELDEQGMNIPVPNKEEYLISLAEVNG